MNVRLQIGLYSLSLIIICFLFRHLSGPFFWGNNSDPSYLYLYNFIYMLEGKSLQFVDHPGIPVDILGSLVLRIFFSPHPQTPWLLTYASRAENVLGVVWFLMLLCYGASLLSLGIYVYSKSKDKIFTALILLNSLWLLIVPSFSHHGILPISANVNSDTMMMSAVNLMILAMLRCYFSPNLGFTHILILALAVSFALATKLTALPYMVVAFCLLNSWIKAFKFMILVVIGFILWTYPIWSSYAHMITWIEGLIMTKGIHGHGGVGFDAQAYGYGLWVMSKENWFFIILWLAALGTAVIAQKAEPKIRNILLAIALGGAAEIIIVGKQPNFQYMAPMIGLSSMVLAFIYKLVPKKHICSFKLLMAALVAVSVIFIGISMWQLNRTTQKTYAMLNTINKDYASCRICPFYRSSTEGFALIFWNRILNREDYSAILKALYPDLIYYDLFGGDFKTSGQQVVPLSMLKQQNACVLLYGTDQEAKNLEPNLTMSKIYTNGGSEALFEVQAQRSNLGAEYLQYAMMLYSQGNLTEALKAAVISEQLGVGSDTSGFINLLKQKIH